MLAKGVRWYVNVLMAMFHLHIQSCSATWLILGSTTYLPTVLNLHVQEAWQSQTLMSFYGELVDPVKDMSTDVDLLLAEQVATGFNLFICSVKRSESEQVRMSNFLPYFTEAMTVAKQQQSCETATVICMTSQTYYPH